MSDALSQALANAAYNSPKGEELHLENLDSIADPSQDGPVPQISNTHNEFEKGQTVGQTRQNLYLRNPLAGSVDQVRTQHLNPNAYLVNSPEQDGLLLAAIKTVEARCDAIYDNFNLRFNYIATNLNQVLDTISKAAESMTSEPNLKHRSLHEWDDTSLLNELVERENDLMPFYFELLKRIGSPELQSLVMSSMQGKNNSMVTLAQLCAAMGSMSSQPQAELSEQQRYVIQRDHSSQPQPQQYVPPHEEYSVVNQLAQARSEAQRQLTQPTAEDYARANKNPDKYGTPAYPSTVLPQNVAPKPFAPYI